MFRTAFSADINALLAKFKMVCVELQSDIKLKNLTMSLYQRFS